MAAVAPFIVSRILVVDTDPGERRLIEAWLAEAGHETCGVADSAAAMARIEGAVFDLILADSMLRDMSGLELTQYMRRHANGRDSRTMIVSARNDAQFVATAFDSGVDDYLSKPLRREELVARVHAALRRPVAVPGGQVLEVGPVRLDKVSHKVTVRDSELSLAPVEFRLMACLMENRGRVMPRRQLLELVWRRRNGIGERTVDVHVRRLRAALEPHACEDLLQTVRGFGYRFG